MRKRGTGGGEPGPASNPLPVRTKPRTPRPGEYQISGKVTSQTSDAIQLRLVRGRELLDEMEVKMLGDAPPYYGTFLFEHVPNGIYNLVGFCNGVTKTADVVIKDGDEIRNFSMPDGNINSILNVTGENTPAVVVGGLDDEAASIAAGAQSVTVTMGVERTEPRPAEHYDSEDEREAQIGIAEIQKQAKLDSPNSEQEFLNITLNRQVDGAAERVRQTNVVLRLVIPFDMTRKRSVCVYSYHDGAVRRFQAYDAYPANGYQDGYFYADRDANLVYVYADKFSVYALSYVDEAAPTAVYKVLQNPDGSWSEPARPERNAKGDYAIPAQAGFRATAYSMDAYQADEAQRSPTAEGRSVALEKHDKLYVYYARNVRRLTFYSDSEGNEVLKSESVLYGAPLAPYEATRPEARENHTFAAWSPDANIRVNALRDKDGNLTEGVTLADWSQTMPDEDLKLYPIWIHDRLEIHLDLGAYDALNNEAWYSSDGADPNTPAEMDASQSRDFTVNLNERVAMKQLAAATRPGYALAGWYTQDGVLWNGEGWEDLPYADGFDETAGWGVTPTYCDKDVTGKAVIGTNAARAFNYYTVTLTARWTPVNVTLTYAGEGEPMPPDAVTRLGDTVIIGAAPAAPGKVFVGWQDANGTLHSPGEEFVFEDWTLQSGGVITLRSTFRNAPAYAISFDSNGGTPVAPIENYALNVPIPAPTEPTKTGYSFNVWRDEQGRAVNFPLTLTAAQNRTFTAEWTVKQYTISFNSNGGTAVAPVTQDYGTLIKAPKPPEKLHYAFGGWSPALPAVMPARNMTVEALWTPNQYTLSYRTDATAPIQQTAPAIYGGLVDKPQSPTKTGYTFLGWSPAFPTYMPESYPVIVGQWRIDAVDASSTDTTITVENPKPEDGYEYSNDGGKTWQDSPVFPNLTPDTVYPISVRKKGTATAAPSPASNPTPVRTKTPAAPAPSGGGGGGGGAASQTYRITVEKAEHGAAEASASRSKAGLPITVTPRPAEGYEAESVSVQTAKGKSVEVEKNAGGTYSFLMPESDVTVKVSFKGVSPADGNAPDTPDTGNNGRNPSGAFPDNDPDENGVSDWLITDEHGAYIQGFSDGTFRPYASITRAQTAMMIYRLLKNQDVEKTAAFYDMDGSEWYAEAVYTLCSLGVIQGYSDGAFRGDSPITRASFTAILTRFLKNQNGDVLAPQTAQFSDVPPEHWAHGTITLAASCGWIGGYGDGTFRPGDQITRAAAVAIINRMLGREADAEYVGAHSGELKNFSDAQDPGAWYYYNVAEAANAHNFRKSDDGQEIWNP